MARQSARTVREFHDEPHIEGTRITVLFVKERVEGRGLDPQTVADRHDLPVAGVYRALAYYHDHPEEMHQIRQQRRDRTKDSRDDPDVVAGPRDLE